MLAAASSRRRAGSRASIAEASARQRVPVYREHQRQMAHRLYAMESSPDALRNRGFSHIGEFGEEIGIASGEARALAALGWCLHRDRRVEQAWTAGKLNLASAVALRRVLSTLDAMTPEERAKADPRGLDWVKQACRTVTTDFTHLVSYMLECWRTGQPPVRMSMWVSVDDRRKFRRARVLAMWRAKKPLTEGEVLGILADHYLDSWDPLNEKVRKRRMPDTSNVHDSRAIPAEVKRAVVHRDNAKCRVPGCDRFMNLQYAHVQPHNKGGSREVKNILLLCFDHNWMNDQGSLVIQGDANDPIFLNRDGRVHIPFLWTRKLGPTVEEWLAAPDKTAFLRGLGIWPTTPSAEHVERVVDQVPKDPPPREDDPYAWFGDEWFEDRPGPAP